jgi:hypothetical protein
MINRQSQKFFWFALIFHAILWTLLPGLLHNGYKPDVIEQLFIGREWVLVSARHPALAANFLELLNLFFSRAFFVPFLASQICMGLTVWAVWKLGRSVLTPFHALVAALSMLAYWFFTIESTKYNVNIPYIAFWTLSICFTYKAVLTNKVQYWILTGAALGLGLQSKYSMILLVFTILFFFVVDSRARKTWKTSGPYLTTLVAFIIFLPSILTLIFRQDLPLPSYIAEPREIPLTQQFYQTIRFSAAQLGFLILPFLILLTVIKIPLKRQKNLTTEQRWCFWFLTVMIFLPLAEHALIGLGYLAKINADYGSPIWPMISVWFLLLFRLREEKEKSESEPILEPAVPAGTKPLIAPKIFIVTLVVIEIILAIAFVIQSCVSPYLLGKPRRFHFPMQELGVACEKIWSEHAAGHCPYTTGNWWLAGNAAEGMRPSPSVHAIGSFARIQVEDSPSNWSTDNDVNSRGGLILWDDNTSTETDIDFLQKRFPKAIRLESLILPYKKFKNISPLKIGMAIVLPAEEPARTELIDK